MIYLFAIACGDPSTNAWWARLLESDRSFCFEGLTSLLEPESTHEARFRWLDELSAGLDFESAQRLAVMRGFPGYFERLWERSRHDGAFHIGNADRSAGRLLPGFWLLWPDTRFVFCYRNGIGSVETASTSDAEFEPACRAWVADVGLLLAHQRWLAARGAHLRRTTLEDLVGHRGELGKLWVWLVGEWEREAPRKRPLVAELGSALEPAASIWKRWPEERRRIFQTICGDVQRELGYPIPGSGWWRRW